MFTIRRKHAIVGAKVSIVEADTGERRETVTNERGEFNAPYLRRGLYTISVAAAGFKGQTFSGVTLAVDQTVRLPITLQPGVVEQSVEVTAAAPLLDSATSSLGQVIDNKKVVDLPLNGRNPFALGLLSGFSAPVKGVSSNLPFVAGGGRWQNNDVLLDGIDNNTMATSGGVGVTGINYTPSVDAVAEFKVKTNNYSAEFGRSVRNDRERDHEVRNQPVAQRDLGVRAQRAVRRQQFLLQCLGNSAPAVQAKPVWLHAGRPCRRPEAVQRPQQDILLRGLRRPAPRHQRLLEPEGHSARSVPHRRFLQLQAAHLRPAGARGRRERRRHQHAISEQPDSRRVAEPGRGRTR